MNDSSIITDDILAHYGVKGMKWGVRKDRKNVATSTPEGGGGGGGKDDDDELHDEVHKWTDYQKEQFTKWMKLSPNNTSTKDFREFYEKGGTGKGTRLGEVDLGSKKSSTIGDWLRKKNILTNTRIVKSLAGFEIKKNPHVKHDSLTHYGVKGMKWGVRKDGKPQGHQGGDSSSKKKKKVEVSSDFTTSSGSRSVRMVRNQNRTTASVRTDLSNESMRKINERLRLENEMNRNLEELRKANRTRGQKVRAHVGDVLLKSSKKAAATMISKAMIDAGTKAIDASKKPK